MQLCPHPHGYIPRILWGSTVISNPDTLLIASVVALRRSCPEGLRILGHQQRLLHSAPELPQPIGLRSCIPSAPTNGIHPMLSNQT
jgi:hypothetical protein